MGWAAGGRRGGARSEPGVREVGLCGAVLCRTLGGLSKGPPPEGVVFFCFGGGNRPKLHRRMGKASGGGGQAAQIPGVWLISLERNIRGGPPKLRGGATLGVCVARTPPCCG